MAAGHKGTGILYIRKEASDKIQPLLLDQGRAVYTTSMGSGNLIGIIALGLAMDFLTAVGMEKVQKHNLELAGYLYGKLKSLRAVRVASPAPGEISSPLVSVSLGDKADNASVAARPAARSIESSSSCCPGKCRAGCGSPATSTTIATTATAWSRRWRRK